MQFVRFADRGTGEPVVGVLPQGHEVVLPLVGFRSLALLLEEPDPEGVAAASLSGATLPLAELRLLAPIDRQEVWAAGVTYERSQSARREESDSAASFYDRVYTAERPELFFKATPHRVSGPGEPLRIRSDARWNVPEPELALVVSSAGVIVGFTIGNDMSSRDIEGENPLYLPQAKVYDRCCGLGPCVTLPSAMPAAAEIGIQLAIHRGGEAIYRGETSTARLARSFDELVSWLFRDQRFPDGVILLTGTGIVPEGDFSLLPGDVVEISIDGIGTLENPIVQGDLTL